MELQGWIATIYVASGVAAAQTTLHAGAVWLSPRGREHLAIAVFAGVSLCFCLLGAHVRQLPELSEHLQAFKIWVATGMLSAVVWPWVIRDFAKLSGVRIPAALSLVYVAQVVAQLALPFGVTYIGVEGTSLVSLPALGISEYQLRGATPPWGLLIALPPVGLFAYGWHAARRLWRTKQKGRSMGLVLATLPQIGAAAHDCLATATDYTAPLFSDFGFLIFGFVLTTAMANELAKAATTQRSLKRSEEQLRATLDAMTDAVFTLDASSRILQVNPAAVQLAGRGPKELIGRQLDEVFEHLSDDTSDGQSAWPTVTLVRPNGVRRTVRRSDALLRSAPDHGDRVVVMTDVTTQKALEKRVRTQQSMESLGQLAAGIAHDFNNMLTGIIGAASLLETESEDLQLRKEYTHLIISTSERAADLTGRLLTFGRSGRLAPEFVRIGSVVDEVTQLVERTIDRRIRVKLDLCSEPDGVAADRGELHSALLNLALNARDAMPNGGTLSFETRVVDVANAGVNRFGFELSPGRFVKISVRDTGVGIAAADLDRIFRPFFTTKTESYGTGLGLAAVWGAVHELQGSIEVESKEGEGTCFHLWIPHRQGTLAALAQPTPRLGVTATRVLLADDEPVVRSTCERSLTRAGFRVEVADDGRDAVERFDRSRESLGLAIFDVMMPRLSGVEACKKVRAKRPDLPILMMTGFVGDEDLSDVSTMQGVFILRKPFRPEELARRALEAAEWRP